MLESAEYANSNINFICSQNYEMGFILTKVFTIHIKIQVEFALTHDTKTAVLTLTGPANVWFGLGFGGSSMNDKPYAIIVDGNGNVTERKLANHGPGTQLNTSIVVVSNIVKENVRILELHRPVKGLSKDHFSLPTKPGDLNMISAVGDSIQLAYHKTRTSGSVTLLPTKNKACVCQPNTKDYITYMNSTTQSFSVYDCLDEPRYR